MASAPTHSTLAASEGVSFSSPPSATSGTSSPAPTASSSGTVGTNNKIATSERVAAEIISTERVYVQSLEQLQNVYLTPLKSSSLQLDSSGLNKVAIEIKNLLGFHTIFEQELRNKLDTCTPAERIDQLGSVFLKYADFLRIYTAYVNGYESVMNSLTMLHAEKKFTKWLAEQKLKHAAPDLVALFITPIQRIPRYELLLKELQKHTLSPSANLNAALAKIQEINQHVNESKRLVDRVSDLLSVQSKLAGSLPTDQMHVFRHGSLYAPHRRLIREGDLKKRGNPGSALSADKLRCYYLFNDLLLWTNRDNKYKEHMMLLHAEVSDPDDASRAGVDPSLAFQVCSNQLICDGPSGAHKLRELEKFVLYAASHEDKKGWVADLNTAIQEAADLQSSAGFLSVVPDRLRRHSEHVKPVVTINNSPPVPSSPLQNPSPAVLPPTHPDHHHHHHNHHHSHVHNHQQFMLGPNAHFSSTPVSTTSPGGSTPITSSTPPPASVASASSASSTSPSPAPIITSALQNGASVAGETNSPAPRERLSVSPLPRRPSAVLGDSPAVNLTIPSTPTTPGGSVSGSPKNDAKAPPALSLGASSSSAQAAELEKQWRATSLKVVTLSRAEITSLRALKNPPAPVKSAMESVGVLLDPAAGSGGGSSTPRFGAAKKEDAVAAAETKKKLVQVDDWSALQSLLVKPNFLALLSAFNVKCAPLNEKAEKKIAALLKDPAMSFEAITKANPTVGTLWAWVCSYYAMKKGDSGATYVFVPPTAAPTPKTTAAAPARPASAGASKPPPLPPRTQSKSPAPTTLRPASASAAAGAKSTLPATKPAASPSALAAAAKAATNGAKSPAASKIAAPLSTTPRRSSSAKKSESGSSTAAPAAAPSPKAGAASPRRSSSAKKYGEKEGEEKAPTPTASKIGAKPVRPVSAASATTSKPATATAAAAAAKAAASPAAAKVGSRPATATSSKLPSAPSTASASKTEASPPSGSSTARTSTKPSLLKSPSGGSLTARATAATASKPATKSASSAASASASSDATTAVTSSAVAAPSNSPPLSELKKCKTQYRNFHTNYFHTATSVFYHQNIGTHAITPVPEPELTKLKADEEKAVADEAEAKRKAAAPIKSKVDSGLAARPASAKAAAAKTATSSSTAASSSVAKPAGAKVAPSAAAVSSKSPRVPAAAAAKNGASAAKKDAAAAKSEPASKAH